MEKKESRVSKILDHIMGGINYMIPCVVAGGMLMAIGYLLDDYSINPKNYGYNTQTAAFFTTVGKASFDFMLPILAGFIGQHIAGNCAIAAGLVGGYLAGQGGAGFLGAIIAGFLAGEMVALFEKVGAKLPESLEGLKIYLIYPVATVLIMGLASNFIITPYVGKFNTLLMGGLDSIGNSSQILLGIIIGGMASVDMGGPINKTANLFAIAALANGNYTLMAANLAGCFIPAYVVAISSTIFKKKYTKEQRASGMAAYVIGLAGITESAIPIVMSDPLRMIPSCIVGSAVAGGMSMAFNCSLMAPFGGVFILPLNSNPVGYVISLLSGIAVASIILAILRRNVPDVVEEEEIPENIVAENAN